MNLFIHRFSYHCIKYLATPGFKGAVFGVWIRIKCYVTLEHSIPSWPPLCWSELALILG